VAIGGVQRGLSRPTSNLMLLAELRHRASEAIDWTGMQHVVPLLDAFEASRDSRARRLCWLKIHPHVARMSRRQIRTAFVSH
jgi:hypothetical protein